jgi:hypothetical protein
MGKHFRHYVIKYNLYTNNSIKTNFFKVNVIYVRTWSPKNSKKVGKHVDTVKFLFPENLSPSMKSFLLKINVLKNSSLCLFVYRYSICLSVCLPAWLVCLAMAYFISQLLSSTFNYSLSCLMITYFLISIQITFEKQLVQPVFSYESFEIHLDWTGQIWIQISSKIFSREIKNVRIMSQVTFVTLKEYIKSF